MPATEKTKLKPKQKRKGRDPTPSELERGRVMLEMYQNGSSLQKIGRQFGVTRQRVYSILRKMPGYESMSAQERKQRRIERLLPLKAKARELLRYKGANNATVAVELGITKSDLEFLRKIAGIRSLGPRIGPPRSGEEVNYWRILGRNAEDPAMLDCICKLCGTEKPVNEKNLDSGLSKSCGCQRGHYPRKNETKAVKNGIHA